MAPNSTRPCPTDKSTKSNKSAKPGKPAKPYLGVPLFPHATGQWAKTIRGKLYCFGIWADPAAALKSDQTSARTCMPAVSPRTTPVAGLTVKEIAKAFLNSKQSLVNSGELSPRTWQEYKDAAHILGRVD